MKRSHTVTATVEERLRDRRNSFDIVRIAAAWLVLFSHSYRLIGDQQDPWQRFMGYGDFGSQSLSVFFIISGLLVSRSWLKDPHPGRYFRRRGLRIMPGLIVCVLLCAIVLGPAFTTLSAGRYFKAHDTWEYLLNCTMYRMKYPLPGVFESHAIQAVNGSLWSLRVEFTMYIVVVVLGLMRLLKPVPLCAVLAAIVVFDWKIVGTFVPRDHGLVEFLTGGRVDLVAYFLAGTMINAASRRIRVDGRIFLLCIGVLGMSAHRSWAAAAYLLTLPYIVIFLGLMRPPAWLDLTRIGDWSYGIYIYAFPVQQMILDLSGRHLQIWEFVLAATIPVIGLAALSWHFIERPCLRMKPARTVSATIEGRNDAPSTIITPSYPAAGNPVTPLASEIT